MAEHNKLGIKGEEIAENYLRKKGFKILRKNYRFGKHEVDLICNDKDEVVVVEVKTRSSPFLSEPEWTVSKKKQRSIIKVTNFYCEDQAVEAEIRFDIISIVLSGSKMRLEHLEDAFYPTL